jgi:TolB protein
MTAANRKSGFRIFLMSFMLVMMNISLAHAELDLSLKSGTIEKLPIAITTFFPEGGADREIAQDMPRVINDNLERTGLFEPMNPRAFIQSVDSIQKDGIRFAEWRAINVQTLVTGVLQKSDDGRTRVEFRLWDVFSEQQLSGMAYTTTKDNWRRIAHIISDDIYKRLTGEESYFDSRIVYVSETGPANMRIKRLAIMDQDGANHNYLTDGSTLVLTPRFSPNQQMITYLAYYNNKPRVYLYDIDTGRQRVLGDFPGMTFSPRFSPDGRNVIMSMMRDGNSDIYIMDLSSKRVNQITNHLAIDTSPSFSPDGKQVVFESDRGGSQQLYVMDATGANPQRITFGAGRYANPVWSPRGDLIAFTRMFKGEFYIGVIRPDGSGERLLTTAYHVEGPTWSPNGRVLAYFKEIPVGAGGNSRQTRVYTVDLTGFNERRVPTPVDGSDPAWSPLNP